MAGKKKRRSTTGKWAPPAKGRKLRSHPERGEGAARPAAHRAAHVTAAHAWCRLRNAPASLAAGLRGALRRAYRQPAPSPDGAARQTSEVAARQAICNLKSAISNPLVLSLLVHAVVLAALGQVGFRPATAAANRPTRVRLMKWDAAAAPGRAPEVSLPGGRTRAVALPAPASEPAAEELQRQMERIAALRDEFFRPMRIATLPMPVLPGLPSRVPAPPFWNMPLNRGLDALPPLPGTLPEDARRMAALLQGDAAGRKARLAEAGTVVTPTEPAAPAPEALGAIVSVPNEGGGPAPAAPAEAVHPEDIQVAQADPGVGQPPANPEGVEPPPAMAGETPPTAPAATDSALVANAGEPATPEKPEPAGAAGTPVDEPKDAPAGGASEARAESPAPGAGGTDPGADAGPERPKDAPAASEPSESAQGAAETAPGPPETAGAGGTEAAESNAERAGAAEPVQAPPIPAGGPLSKVAGSYRIPLGLTLPGFAPSEAMASLLKEVGARTSLQVASAGFVSPQGLPSEAPLLYLKGTGKIELTEEQRASLGGYVGKGGTLFIDGMDGEFGESVRAELERLFPGKAPERVPTTDALYSAHYRLAGAPGAKLFPLRAIRLDGRPAVILSSAFLGRRWQRAADPEHEAAVALGVNLVVSAAAGRK